MRKIPCHIIQDLMVLYEDNVCSEESRQIVEEHIAECEECRKLYQIARVEIPDITLGGTEENDFRDAAEELKKIARNTCKRLERRVTYKHILTVAITIFLLMISYTFWTEWLQYRVNVVPPEDIKVTELYELENGDIYCTFQCKDMFTHVNTSGIMVPEDKRYQDYDGGWQEIYFQYPHPFERIIPELSYGDTVSVVFPMQVVQSDTFEKSEEGEWGYVDGYRHRAVSIYYGKGKREDQLLVWEQGQKIEPAPADVEKRVKEEGFIYEVNHCFREEMILPKKSS